MSRRSKEVPCDPRAGLGQPVLPNGPRPTQGRRAGYVRPSDEWMDGNGEPLPDVLQDAAHRCVEAGFLPEFEEYM